MTVDGHTVSTDSIVVLVSALYPALFTDSVRTDSAVVAIALDTLGTVVEQKLTTLSSIGPIAERETLFNVFPGIDRQRVLAGGWVAGPIGIRGKPTKTLAIIFGLVK